MLGVSVCCHIQATLRYTYTIRKKRGSERVRLRRKQFCACVAAVFLALVFSVLTAFSVLAEEETAVPEESAHVHVSIVDAGGKAVLACQELPLRDADGDGELTVRDALLVAYDAQSDGSVQAEYAPEQAEDGRIEAMFFGESDDRIEIYVNHASVRDLFSPIADGDLLYAFVCGNSDDALYCYFDVSHASVGGGESLTLSLIAADPEEEGLPVAGAVIQIDGKDTAFRTDEDGKVTLQFDGSGSCVVSARKEGVTLVPPVCAVSVSNEEPFAGDRFMPLFWILLSVGALAGIVLALRWRVRRADSL